MDKNMTKKRKTKKAHQEPRRQLRAGALALLVAGGVGSMAGMALFNAHAKPKRDMKWYVREGAVQVAAPAMGEGFAVEEAVPATASRGLKGRDILSAATAQRAERTPDATAEEEAEEESEEALTADIGEATDDDSAGEGLREAECALAREPGE